ncbi:MAG: type II toxin-antitoxin system RelE/ParE family toxin [Chromatiaceae bacterium]|nr:type II toxin-antitoxin system RelE/ParE family toxin [Chromatiaceae bacterium]MCF8005521.1 type II toxin-antitoxin system RelE/ParE family toxin [Chromatiaceae bacterium]MCF8015401.1 type II toxin-antitoxin system RelE/ParE family toxin [Chromatiaceae bacterium]
MAWQVELTNRAQREIGRLDRTAQRRIGTFIRERLMTEDNPRRLGKALQGAFAGLWRYRIGDYRLICQIIDERCVVLALSIDHRSKVYR